MLLNSSSKILKQQSKSTEKITFYKFGLKLGIARFATNGLVVNEQGIIRYCGYMIPEVQDRQVMTDICILFGVKCIF